MCNCNVRELETVSYTFLSTITFCNITLISNSEIEYVHTILHGKSHINVVQQRMCSAKQRMCINRLEGINVKKFHVFIVSREMSQASRIEGINSVHIALDWTKRQEDWVNIMLHGSKDKKKQMQYELTMHELHVGQLDLLRMTSHMFKYIVGVDMLLSVNQAHQWILNTKLLTVRYI